MKKLLLGCIAAVAALMALSGCDQDKVAYNGPSYLMFSDRFIRMPCKKRMRYSMFRSLLLWLPIMTGPSLSK